MWIKKTQEKIVYLTFDDGPTPEVTPFVLEQLSKYNAQATFFCVGENVERYPDLHKNVLNDGHSVGNHTHTHLDAWFTPKAKWKADFENAEKFIDSKLMRPPYGKLTWSLQQYLKKKEYLPVMWSFITYDFDEKANPEVALKMLEKRLKKGEIIVMHDQPKANKNLRLLLPKLLAFYHKEGFQFKSL